MKSLTKIRLALLATTLAVGAAWNCTTDYLADGVPYKHQVDSRNREYMNVTVIDKSQSRTCNKSGSSCKDYYELVVTNGHREIWINVDESSYNSAIVGGAVGFERSLVDEKVLSYIYNEHNFLINFLFMLLFAACLSVFLVVLLFAESDE